MTNEDESTDPRMTAAEREILKFLGDREANEAAQEDRGRLPSTNSLSIRHPQILPNKRRPSKNWPQ